MVRDGVAFPQLEELPPTEGDAFFQGQTYTGVAQDQDSGQVVGLYILHPNNVTAVDGLTIKLMPGETIGIVGESG